MATEKVNIYNVSGTLTLNVYSGIDQKYEITLFEISGRKLFDSQQNFSKGNNEIKFNTQQIARGVYFITL